MTSSEAQKRLRRSKDSERDFGKFLLKHNGPDPILQRVASSTGRVGHITDLQFDVVSRDYAGENKRVRLPAQLLGWWSKICEIAAKHGKHPLLRIVPSNSGTHEEMHVITAARHAELLRYERLGRLSLEMSESNAALRREKDGPEWC